MPAQEFNIGRDVTLDIVDPTQGPLRFKLVTSFEGTPKYKELESGALDGVPRFAYLPAGHELVFEFDRADNRADDYFCRIEQNYFNGAVTPNVTITETVQEVNGAISQYRYTGVALSLTKTGPWKGDSLVGQSIRGMASRKVKIA